MRNNNAVKSWCSRPNLFKKNWNSDSLSAVSFNGAELLLLWMTSFSSFSMISINVKVILAVERTISDALIPLSDTESENPNWGSKESSMNEVAFNWEFGRLLPKHR